MSRNIVIQKRFNPATISRQTRAVVMTVLTDLERHWEGQAADVVGEGHSDTGALFDSIQVRKFEDKKTMGLQSFLNSKTDVYGRVIHDGRDVPSRKPPFTAIKKWCIRKLGIQEDAKHLFAVVQAIRENIAKNGFKTIPRDGLQFFWGPLVSNYKDYKQRIASALKLAAKKGKTAQKSKAKVK